MPLRKDIEKSQRLGTMRQLNPEKLANLPAFNQQLDEEYGKPGTHEREEFHKEALSWYYGQLLRNRRRELK